MEVLEAWAEGDRQQMRPLTNSSGHEGYSEKIWKPLWENTMAERGCGKSRSYQTTQLPPRESDEIKGMENISDFLVSSEVCSIALTLSAIL